MSTSILPGMLGGAVGRAHPRVEGHDKVAGTARYAVEYPVEGVTYAWAVPATIARGWITGIDAAAALGTPGVLAATSKRPTRHLRSRSTTTTGRRPTTTTRWSRMRPPRSGLRHPGLWTS